MLVPRLFSVPLIAAAATADISIIIMSDAIKVIYIYCVCDHKHTDNLSAFVARARDIVGCTVGSARIIVLRLCACVCVCTGCKKKKKINKNRENEGELRYKPPRNMIHNNE